MSTTRLQEVLIPAMIAGWSQCDPPEPEVKEDVHD